MQTDDARTARLNEQARGHVWHAALPAAILLYYGFGQDPTGISDSELYNQSVQAMNYMAKGGGIAFAAIAAGCMAGIGMVLAADAVVSITCGAVMVVCGATWLANGDGLYGVVFLVLGGMFVSSGRQTWRMFAGGAEHSDEAQGPGATGPDELARPDAAGAPPLAARPAEPARANEPPADAAGASPAEGFLAALAREEEDTQGGERRDRLP